MITAMRSLLLIRGSDEYGLRVLSSAGRKLERINLIRSCVYLASCVFDTRHSAVALCPSGYALPASVHVAGFDPSQFMLDPVVPIAVAAKKLASNLGYSPLTKSGFTVPLYRQLLFGVALLGVWLYCLCMYVRAHVCVYIGVHVRMCTHSAGYLSWTYGSVCCACSQRPGLPRACHSSWLACHALQAALSAYAACAPRARLRQSFSRSLRSHKT
jgi:hypothetical protein